MTTDSIPDRRELVTALAKAQGEFPDIKKTKTAKAQSFSYKYADLADVLSAVRPVLSKHGLAVTQSTKVGERGTVLVTELLHVSGASLSSELEMQHSTGKPQDFGGALTYLRRYAVVTLLGIQADEDTDARDIPAGKAMKPPALDAADAEGRKIVLDWHKVFLGDRGQDAYDHLCRLLQERTGVDMPVVAVSAVSAFASKVHAQQQNAQATA